jgi:hypothetical protein
LGLPEAIWLVKHIKHDLIWGKKGEEAVEGRGRQGDGGNQYGSRQSTGIIFVNKKIIIIK